MGNLTLQIGALSRQISASDENMTDVLTEVVAATGGPQGGHGHAAGGLGAADSSPLPGGRGERPTAAGGGDGGRGWRAAGGAGVGGNKKPGLCGRAGLGGASRQVSRYPAHAAAVLLLLRAAGRLRGYSR